MKRVLCFLLALSCLLPLMPTAFAAKEKRIALTFDDGPHPHNTKEILALLSEYRISATFFVIGENISYFPESFDLLLGAGHEIGNHTDTHPKLKGQGEGALADEIRRCEEKILERGGTRPTLFRPPEGVRSEAVTAVCQREGYRTVYWTVDTLDWTGASADAIERAILAGVKDGSIILCHDYIVGGGHTVEALRRVLPRLLAEGYRFVLVSELLAG